MYRLHPSSRAATHISAIMHEQFTSPYHCWFEVPPDVHDIWWRKKRYVWDPTLSTTNMRHQVDLTERFSKSRHLEELHKHRTKDKTGQYVDFHSEEFWAKEEATATGAPMPDDLQLTSTIFGGLSRDCYKELVLRQLISEPKTIMP
ncbi:hypothetical protein M9H77_07676 [Catharanthus roseus]|uniref:Uncharacterized protein n=1 Tax=Catharanthus roseus TaxID=4058 RepID=A0ACC0BVN7_CATRO|nr:hypothetical protein M9H77_07676 [Catharanthus roseus]